MAPVGFEATPQFKALTSSADPTTETGSDISTFPNLDPSMTPVQSARLVGESIARRFITPRGQMAFHPDDGTDLRSRLNGVVTSDSLAQMKNDIEMEALQDERISSADVSLTFDSRLRVLNINLSVELEQGPYRYTISVDQITATLLSVQEA